MDFQTFQNVVDIIGRVLFGLICVGFFVSMFLYKKYKFFEDLLGGTGLVLLWTGFSYMMTYVIFGFEIHL